MLLGARHENGRRPLEWLSTGGRMHSWSKIPLALLSLALATVLFVTSTAYGLTAQHRLGHEAMPTFEDIRLNVDANQPNYTGSVRIALKVAAATDSFQLHSL